MSGWWWVVGLAAVAVAAMLFILAFALCQTAAMNPPEWDGTDEFDEFLHALGGDAA